MDIFAHTLWTAAAAKKAKKVAEKKNKKLELNVGWAAFWGVFPDFFAFGIPFVLTFFKIFSGQLSWSQAGAHHGAVAGFDIAHYLYQYSHSLVIWALVFGVVWFICRRPRYELFGWALHILIDIPSHTLAFFPTPFLFPISTYHFPYGVSWANTWYMIINYSLLAIVWGIYVYKYFRKSTSQK